MLKSPAGKVLALLVLIAVAATVAFFLNSGSDVADPNPGDAEKPGIAKPEAPPPSPAPSESGPDGPTGVASTYDIPESQGPTRFAREDPAKDTRFKRLDDGRVIVNAGYEHAERLHRKEADTYQDLEEIDGMLSQYRWVYQQNPVGDNEDIVAQLTGSNARKIVVLPPDHPSINSMGQLIDRYGTPYFFHAVTERAMDIWSYGLDGLPGTIDDVKLHGDELYKAIDPDPETETAE